MALGLDQSQLADVVEFTDLPLIALHDASSS